MIVFVNICELVQFKVSPTSMFFRQTGSMKKEGRIYGSGESCFKLFNINVNRKKVSFE